jgi:hypothetical protein
MRSAAVALFLVPLFLVALAMLYSTTEPMSLPNTPTGPQIVVPLR